MLTTDVVSFIIINVEEMHMSKYIGTVITALIVVTGVVLGFVFGGQQLSQLQLDTLLILVIICGSSALYCFVVGEIARNNSQMDKLWSLLPIAYTWVIAIKGNMNPRLVIIAILVTLWGLRLTMNFARKGAYSIKFWSGEEDYRWQVLRQNKFLKSRPAWALFDLFFISIYQNALVLAICLPALVCMGSDAPLGTMDYVAIALTSVSLLIEVIADEQQMAFHTTKKKLLAEGKTLEELPAPFNKGFNTTGLWARSRHPNYFGEQAFWVCLYLFVIGAGLATYNVFNWSMVGGLMLVLLFLGSSAFGEGVSNKKYPEYQLYLKSVSKYLPLRKYNPKKSK